MYCRQGRILGVRLHTSSDTRLIGQDYWATPKFFPLHGPREVITEIKLRTYSVGLYPPDVMVRTHGKYTTVLCAEAFG